LVLQIKYFCAWFQFRWNQALVFYKVGEFSENLKQVQVEYLFFWISALAGIKKVIDYK